MSRQFPDIVLLDGPVGTELERRGFPLGNPLWSAAVIDAEPGLLLEIHRDYLDAGADIITANTFRTNPNSVADAGSDPADAARLTADSLALAKRAAAQHPHARVAGSIAPVGDCYRPGERGSERFLQLDHESHIANIVEAGADLLLLETMNSLPETLLATRLALEHTLPVLVSLVTDRSGTNLLDGTDLAVAVSRLAMLGPDGILLNCGSPTATVAGIDVLAKYRIEKRESFRIGGYPNSGDPDPEKGWDMVRDVDVEDFLLAARRILEMGAEVVGSCCGTTPETTRRLRGLIDDRRPGS